MKTLLSLGALLLAGLFAAAAHAQSVYRPEPTGPAAAQVLQRIQMLRSLAAESLDDAIAEARAIERQLAGESSGFGRRALAAVRAELGRALLQANRPMEAAEPLRLAVAVLRADVELALRSGYPSSAQLHAHSKAVVELAAAYIALGRRSDAAAVYEAALAIDEGPFSVVIRLGAGRLAASAGDLTAARHHFDIAHGQLTRDVPPGFDAMMRAASAVMAGLSNACLMAKSLARAMFVDDTGPSGRARPCLKPILSELAQVRIELAAILQRLGAVDDLVALYKEAARPAEPVAPPFPMPFISGVPADAGWEDEDVFRALAAALGAVGRTELAREAIGRALEAGRSRIRTSAAQVSAALLWDPVARYRESLFAWIGFEVDSGGVATYAPLIDEIMGAQGIVLRLMAAQRQRIAVSADRRVRMFARRLAELRERELGLNPDDGMWYLEQHAMVLAERMQVEQQLRALLGDEDIDQLGDSLALGPRVARALGSRTLLGFIKYRRTDGSGSTATHYGGYRIGPGSEARLVDLGPAVQIDALVARLRGDMDQRAGSGAAPSGEPPAGARELYRRLIAPLGAGQPAAQETIVVPDGQLALLPFEALVDAEGRFLIERSQWRYLNSPRELLEGRQRTARPSRTAVVIGDPDFESNAVAKGGAKPALVAMRGFGRAALRDARFSKLPDTRGEAESVAASMKRRMDLDVALMLGAQASAEGLAAVRSPRVLHLATHGFYLSGLAEPIEVRPQPDQTPVEVWIDRTDLAAGLALAGANDGLARGSADGIAFLGDLRRLQLQGTELVVLSACDTGVGQVESGEGVLSLRSAIHESGAASVIASLWVVPSAPTTRLMQSFYERYAESADASQALAEAKRRMLKSGHGPEAWAAFVLSGAESAARSAGP